MLIDADCVPLIELKAGFVQTFQHIRVITTGTYKEKETKK